MQIKMLKQKVVKGDHVKINTVIDADELDAKFLVGSGSAEYFTPPKPKARRKSRKHDV